MTGNTRKEKEMERERRREGRKEGSIVGAKSLDNCGSNL